MTLIADPTTLTDTEAKAVVQRWIQQGLPSGDMGPALHQLHALFLFIQTPAEVAIWAAALRQDIALQGEYLSTVRCKPIELGGWALDVYCNAPIVPASLRIQCESGDSW